MPSLADHQELLQIYDYDPITGILRRMVSCGRSYAGQIITGDSINLKYRRVTVGRVIWCLYYGEWPPDNMVVDHINRKHVDNRICNLRLATKAQNGYNINYGPTYGTYKVSSRKWAARIITSGKLIYLGCFNTQEEAAKVARETAKETRGEFACQV